MGNARSGYRNYTVRIFQPDSDRDMSAELRRDLRPISTDYNLLSLLPEKGSFQDGWYECADEIYKRLNELPYAFTTKHDAMIFGDNMKNLIVRLLTREHVPLKTVNYRLKGDDTDGYSLKFEPKYDSF